MFASFPEMKQSGSQAEAPVGVAGLDQIVERRAEVIVLELKTVKPFWMNHRIFGAFFSKHEVISGVGSASLCLIVALSQTFQSIFPDGGEHHEARFGIDLLHMLG